MNTGDLRNQLNVDAFSIHVKQRSDKLMNYFLIGLFLAGLIFAMFYDTWLIAFGVGGLCLIAYYSCKIALPDSNLYQYILSVVLGIFMAQYIYQMHGMFEMHFFAFIGSAILITYQNWKLQIPIMLVVVIHHATFSYLQNIGIDKIYFTQLDNFDLQTFIIHVLLAAVIFFICGLWSYQLKKYNEKEALIQLERKQNSELLEKAYVKAEKARLEAEQANEKAEQANKDLERKNKEMEQFAYIASHDLQEPLRTTSSFVALLQKQYQGKFDEKADKYFDFISDASDRMKVLIRNLLDYSRIGHKKELELVDCNKMLHSVLADLAIAISETGADIKHDPLPVINGYSTELKQLFQNLITNGIKFRKIETSPEMNISVQKNGDFWQFAFKDNGIGIEAKYNEKIFVIFQRLHTQTEYEGSGIGLSHCKKIVELHNGRIWVQSTHGHGSTFNFTLAAKHVGIHENNPV
jgi:two-component system sensor histidine kinase/response regulator